jgi:tetratricopeptide (TPR) repeat protein
LERIKEGHMRHASLAFATVLAASSLTGAASAYVMVIGGQATVCYENARAELSTPRALEQCNGALLEALEPRDRAGTHVNRGIVHMNRHAHQLALADFDRAITLAPDLAEGHINRGAALLARGDYEGALAAINRGLELTPEEPARAYYNRGVANEELGNVREAYEDYQRAAQLAPQWGQPRIELARFQVVR